MKEKKYIDNRKHISDAILNGAALGNSITTHKFSLVSANLLRFLPELGFEQHKTIFREIILYNQLTHFEQKHTDVLNAITVENLSDSLFWLIKQKPCIFSSFHFGMYRLMNLFLAKHKIPFSIVITKESLVKEGELFRKMFTELYSVDSQESIRFIEMESSSLGLKMIRELKEGRSLFIYFDGYRGTGNVRSNDRYTMDGKISFLEHSILARQGIAYIAHLAGVPLIAGFSYYKKIDDLRLRFFDPVFPDSSVPRKLFAHSSTQVLYDQFAHFVRIYPGQWEAWLYLHRSIESESLVSAKERYSEIQQTHYSNVKLNHLKYAVFSVGGINFLFDKISYNSYPIGKETFDLLESLAYTIKNVSEINDQLYEELSQKGVIIPAAA